MLTGVQGRQAARVCVVGGGGPFICLGHKQIYSRTHDKPELVSGTDIDPRARWSPCHQPAFLTGPGEGPLQGLPGKGTELPNGHPDLALRCV